MDSKRNPTDAGLAAAFGRTTPPKSVLDFVEGRTGASPRISLREDQTPPGAPLIDPRSPEKLALPQGRGTYQLLGEIARGGMGVVLKGHDADLGRDVALKVLNEKYTSRPDILQRFVEEAQIGGQLQHPGIVPVYELGLMADERPYFTMKLVKGQTLATLLSERVAPTDDRRRMIDVFESVCQTMAYAHSRGVIHRDLKPGNVMVGAFGEVQVVDWGLAKVLARGAEVDVPRGSHADRTVLETVRSDGSGSGSDSLVGSVMGTPAYMSPEQAQGLVDRLDERTDVFALGAVLCEILTGRPPYDPEAQDERGILALAAGGRLEGAHSRLESSGADPELIELAKGCLIAAPAARPRNAKVVAETLHRHLASVEERVQEARVEAAVQRRGRKLTVALAATLLVAGFGTTAGWLWIREERIAREREVVAVVNTALNEASVLQGQGDWIEAHAAVDRAEAMAEAGDADRGLHASVAAARQEVEAAEGRALVRTERERRAAAFLAELEEIDQGSAESWIFDWRRMDEDYARAFADFGVDVDGGEPAAAAAALKERGVGEELVPLLDRWLAVRRMREDREAALRLVELAHRVDEDPLRADLREAILNDDVEMLVQLAEGDLSDQPASTLVLLGTALDLGGEKAEALRILRQASRRYPDEFAVRMALASVLRPRRGWTRDDGLEARRHLEAALALRPGNYAVREYLFEVLTSLARNSTIRGDEAAAAALHREAAAGLAVLYEDRAELSAWERAYRGMSLEGSGDLEAGLEEYRSYVDQEWNIKDEGLTLDDVRWLSRQVGHGLVMAGDLETAARCYERVLPGESDDKRLEMACYVDRAAVRILRGIRSGDVEAAVATLWSAAENCPVARVTRNEPVFNNNLVWWFARHSRAALLEACRPAPGAETQRVNEDLDRLLRECLRMSELAIEAMDEYEMWSTLGSVRYRTGDLEGSRKALEESMRRNEEGGNFNSWCFAAFASHGLGDEAEARSWFERARQRIRNYAVDGSNWRANLLLARELEALFNGGEEGR